MTTAIARLIAIVAIATLIACGNPLPADTVTWTSSDTAVVTIDPDGGIVTSLTTGTTNVTAISTDDPIVNDAIALTIAPRRPPLDPPVRHRHQRLHERNCNGHERQHVHRRLHPWRPRRQQRRQLRCLHPLEVDGARRGRPHANGTTRHRS